jgi:hypothetical protein
MCFLSHTGDDYIQFRAQHQLKAGWHQSPGILIGSTQASERLTNKSNFISIKVKTGIRFEGFGAKPAQLLNMGNIKKVKVKCSRYRPGCGPEGG